MDISRLQGVAQVRSHFLKFLRLSRLLRGLLRDQVSGRLENVLTVGCYMGTLSDSASLRCVPFPQRDLLSIGTVVTSCSTITAKWGEHILYSRVSR